MYKKISYVVLMMLLLLCIITPKEAYAVKGADVSSLTAQEALGVKYNECGIQKDMLTILKNHGITLARIRLFVNPSEPQNLAYVTALAARCKSAGMQVMLTLHYSDTWADPSAQTKPAAWKRLTQAALVTKVYDYTYSVCSAIQPDYVQIGNETTCGMLWPNGNACNGNWANLRAFITSGHNAVKAACSATTIVHVSESNADDLKWFFDTLLSGSVSFDAIGISYYPEWHGDIANLDAMNTQAESYGKPVIVCEIGDYYTGTGYSEDTQAQFVTDVLAVNSNAIYWEPGWVWDSSVGYKALFKPISGNWQNVEMTKGLVAFGGNACGGGCTVSTMHVASIVCGTKSGSQGKKYGTATVTVQNNCGSAVSGVTVTGTFSGSYNETRSGTTNSSGQVVLTTLAQVKSPAFTFCVSNLSGTLTYRSQDNVVTCANY